MNDDLIDTLDMTSTPPGPGRSVTPSNIASAPTDELVLTGSEEARINLEVLIEAPPARPSEMVALHIVESGRRPIRIMDEPRD